MSTFTATGITSTGTPAAIKESHDPTDGLSHEGLIRSEDWKKRAFVAFLFLSDPRKLFYQTLISVAKGGIKHRAVSIYFLVRPFIMKSWLGTIMGICLIFAFLGCAALTTYRPNYHPSEGETSIGPPDWYLNEADGPFETINPRGR